MSKYQKKNKVLIIASHPDDEILGCGGTIARLISEGDEVNVLILGEGITSRNDIDAVEVKIQVKKLHEQSQKIADFLGCNKLYMENFPDNRFDTVALLDIIQKIEEVINEIQPKIVYTQHGGDLNIDHAITFRATMTALRPMVNTSVKALYAYEVASSTEWAMQKFSPAFKPSRFVDISKFFDKKIEAMKMYEGETREFPHPRSEKALYSQACKWGSSVGLEKTEAFEIIYEKI